MSGDGELSECFIEPDGTIVINHSSYEDWQDVDEMDVLFGLEFLDPLADDRTLVARLVDDIFDSKYCPRENLGSVAADMVKAAIKRLAGMEANQ